jgi:hypothetical protein
MLKGNAPVVFLIVSFLGVAGAVSLRFVTAPVDWMQHVRELLNQRKDAMQEEACGLGLVEMTDISAGLMWSFRRHDATI